MPISRPFLPALLTLSAALAACTNDGPKATPPGPTNASVRGSSVGIELTWWVVDESGQGTGPLDRALEPFASRPVPVSWRTLDAWHANGLRLISVPAGELEALRANLQIRGAMQSQWLGLTPRWTEIAAGPTSDAPSLIAMDNGVLNLGAGQLRLLLRAWATPWRQPEGQPELTTPAGALQVEMVPQFVPQKRRDALVLPGTATGPEPLTFSRLALEASLVTDDALVIVPEGGVADGGEAGSHMGPHDAALATLGESMLYTLDAARNRRARVVVVLTPGIPAEFRLLPAPDR